MTESRPDSPPDRPADSPSGSPPDRPSGSPSGNPADRAASESDHADGLPSGGSAFAESAASRRESPREEGDPPSGLGQPELLTGLGHALRTPLNGILGMSELLVESELSPRQRQFASAIHDSGVALLELAKDLLDLSRLEAGTLELHAQPFDPGELLRETARAYRLRAQAKRLEIQVYADDLPARLRGDGPRLRQVVAHLLSNALLQTDRGRIAIAADSAPLDEGRTQLRVRVTDTGRGIPDDARDRVFEPFARLGTSTSGQPVGSGLGLAVARRIVERMGGEMGFESWEGSGATFWLRVPLESVEAAGDGRAVGDRGRAQTSEAAAELGARVDVEESWPEISVETVMAVAGITPEERERRRARREERRRARDEERRAAVEAPAAESAGPTRASEADRQRRAGTRILVVEDNPVNQLLAVHQLKFLGYGVEAVSDGHEALAILDDRPFDLVLMDCELPDLDGYETTRRLRASHSRARLVPIVAVTAHADEGQRERCLQAGMNDYLAKPYREKDLLGILDKNLRR